MNYQTKQLIKIEERLDPLRTSLLQHKVYREIDQLEPLRIFMEHHVYAVWDFMSLLKDLQRRICFTGNPWMPFSDTEGSRFINEIVLAEETDEDGNGGFASHFELYHRSMVQCGANTKPIDEFLGKLKQGLDVSSALDTTSVPESARRFVQSTFDFIENGDVCQIASAFAFGREDLLPDVFQQIVDSLNNECGGKLERFKFYLERHIELDGDEHGPMATRLIQKLCGDDANRWSSVEKAAINCLQARLELWDGISAAIQETSTVSK